MAAISALGLLLAGCVGAPPDRAAGVGFGDYASYLAQREAALMGAASIPPAMSPPAAATASGGQPVGAPLNVMRAALPPAAPEPTSTAPGNRGISDENDFAAVAARETIESDRARIEANRAAYEQLEAPPLPERGSAASGPNLAAFALAAPNRLGEPIFARSSLKFANHDRACGKFVSADLAQRAFLLNGGPQRDPGNLDPDGDGFACSWDPTPFQLVRN
jgi:hypothetical protein